MVNISELALTGWWPGCDLLENEESSGFECTGTPSSFEPVRLDLSGKTCYINPFRTEKDAVHWFGTDPAFPDAETFVYTIVIRDDMAKQYYPTDCENGICSCESIEPLRKNWDRFGLACITPLVGCARALADFEPNSCGAIASLSYTNPTERTIFMFQASLEYLVPTKDFTNNSVHSESAAQSLDGYRGVFNTVIVLSIFVFFRQ